MPTQEITLSDVTLSCYVDGPESGPLAICLHGFPDTRETFRHLTPALVAAGYRVVVPAMRGYAPSSLSQSGTYELVALASDALELHRIFSGGEDAVIIGHDWGAGALYLAVAAQPTFWRKAVPMAVPPPLAFAQAMSSYDQLRASWYMWFFQLPFAQDIVAMNDFAIIERLWREWSPGYDAASDVQSVRDALQTPENLLAAIGYYRAMFTGTVSNSEHQTIQDARFNATDVPLLYIHGADDGCLLLPGIKAGLDSLDATTRVEVIANAGHFAHLEQPRIVNELIIEWLAS